MSFPTGHPSAERRVEIDLAAVRHNVRHIAGVVSPARLMAVVKADGYGHGAVPVARAALEAGATWLGVAHISEALELREAGIDAPILAWLHTVDSDFGAAISNGIDIGVSGWELEHVVAAARHQEQPVRIHLKIDTGLGRNGCPPEHWEALISRVVEHQDAGLLQAVGVFSHLAVADEPDRTETGEQVLRFREAVAVAENAGVNVELRHLANTPAALAHPDTHFDLVRVGLGIYGLSPFTGKSSAGLGLRPAMRFVTSVAHCKEVPAGQGVSYGLTYRTTKPTTLALIPVGYADGVPRVATGAPVLVGGRSYPVVGKIAMDQLVIDLQTTGIAGTEHSVLGQPAVLFGGNPSEPTADDWADASGSINYEIVTRISGRVPRIYRNGTPLDGTDTDADQ